MGDGDRKGDKKKKCYQKKDNKKINLGVDNLMNDIMGDWTFIKCRVANATKASIPCLWKRLGWWRNTPFLGVEIAIKKIYILFLFQTFLNTYKDKRDIAPITWLQESVHTWFTEFCDSHSQVNRDDNLMLISVQNPPLANKEILHFINEDFMNKNKDKIISDLRPLLDDGSISKIPMTYEDISC